MSGEEPTNSCELDPATGECIQEDDFTDATVTDGTTD